MALGCTDQREICFLKVECVKFILFPEIWELGGLLIIYFEQIYIQTGAAREAFDTPRPIPLFKLMPAHAYCRSVGTSPSFKQVLIMIHW